MIQLLYLAAGGIIGTMGRYLCVAAVQNWFGNIFPYGTLSVNMLGSLLIGVALAASDQFAIHSNWRVFLFIGLFGSFTTFSSFTMETMNLLRAGNLKAAILYIAISNILGLIMVIGGHQITNWAMK